MLYTHAHMCDRNMVKIHVWSCLLVQILPLINHDNMNINHTIPHHQVIPIDTVVTLRLLSIPSGLSPHIYFIKIQHFQSFVSHFTILSCPTDIFYVCYNFIITELTEDIYKTSLWRNSSVAFFLAFLYVFLNIMAWSKHYSFDQFKILIIYVQWI